jgi:hypothetical protein
VPLWFTRAGLIFGVVMLVVSLAAFAWTKDTFHLTSAQGLAFGAALLALIHQARKKGIAAGEPPPPDPPVSHSAALTAAFLLPAAALALLYEWRLSSFWTPIVLFVLLFLAFMALFHGLRLTRQIRSPRSSPDGP